MFYKYVKIGDRIEISEKTGNKGVMFSQVEGMPEHGELLIRTPVVKGRIAEIPASSEINIIIFTEKGMFRFGVYVIWSYKQDSFGLLHIKILGDGERVQRRDFYRLNCETPFYFKQVLDYNEPFESKDTFYGIVLDISGGGMRFKCNERLTENAFVQGIIELDNERALVAGRVLDSKELFDTSSVFNFQYRIQFVILPDEVMEKIMQYILNGQRKQLQRRYQ